mmetsp:Transcript_39556/g.112189  ORF Transcript_39556/g.112189 Transcript_39556/m.112189 type:complete len:474 (-) Transcript_39556:235-1656(-)|eukprot:CAMPEP_0117674864 /NCGR_PEP_ID=MMETSP0804-20121206/15287_1 /TAXON_ID=1074897 /ORGANISM="Tetraselmis astigmatica, Strain CCMP880" /LENGTH=473 /DNA_ID=CAMNT_0005483805 /DNA_START=97 /DNA_END=1518 /DNA_ORIENTATION=+
MNRNVALGLGLAASAGLSESVWGTTVLSAFIYLLTDGSNLAVGYAEGVQGVSALLSALPVGWLADHWPRSRMLAIGGVADLAAIAITAYVVFASGPIWLLMVGLVFWGVVNTTTYGPSQALYADSVPTGERSKYFNYLYLCWLLPSAVGPLVSVLMFHFLGDTWTIQDLQPIFYCGLVLEIPAAIILFLFDDKHALGSESDHIAPDASSAAEPLLSGAEGQAEDQAEDGEESQSGSRKAKDSAIPLSSVPYILFAADFVGALGAGMTVKFFPLFFKNDIGLSPKVVQGIYAAVPLCIGLASTLCTWVAEHIGRVQTIILSKAMGTSMLFLIIHLKQSCSALLIISIYLVRAAFQNAAYPLSESILMDYVAKKYRARWKSVESVVQFGWCGSAVLGGWIGDRYGYSSTFLATACLQTLGCLCFLVLLGLVPAKEGRTVDTQPMCAAAEYDEQPSVINAPGTDRAGMQQPESLPA